MGFFFIIIIVKYLEMESDLKLFQGFQFDKIAIKYEIKYKKFTSLNFKI